MRDTAGTGRMAVDLHMLISSRFRRDLNVYEEATALFSAAEAGMTRTQICKAAGLKAAEVRAGITAGGLHAKARQASRAGRLRMEPGGTGAAGSPFQSALQAME